MAKTKSPAKRIGRPPTNKAKVAFWCRFDTNLVEDFDKIIGDMKPKPSRAAMIEVIVEEWVDKNRHRIPK